MEKADIPNKSIKARHNNSVLILNFFDVHRDLKYLSRIIYVIMM